MIAADGKTIPLHSVSAFGPENAILIGGSDTTYTCNYDFDRYSILNISGSKSFTIQGGVLKYGNGYINHYFIIVNGIGGASLCLSNVEIEFVSAMNSMVFILGGKVTLKKVKMDNQLNTNWVSPLVYSHSSTSSVTVDLHSCTITNSNYKNVNSSLARSAVVYFVNQNTVTQSVTLNISACLCVNNTFDLTNSWSWGGGFGFFYSNETFSCMWFFFQIFF
jgi:hypothetical protein